MALKKTILLDNSRIFLSLAFFILSLILSQPLLARGVSEQQRAYQEEVGRVFSQSVVPLSEGTVRALEIRRTFAQLRQKYDLPYSDEAGILDSIVDDLAQKELNPEEGEQFFAMLMDGRLEQYRLALRRQQTEQMQLQVLRDLQAMLRGSEEEKSAEVLRSYVHNLYRITGAQYDEMYLEITNLIDNYESRTINSDELLGQLTRIREQTSPVNDNPNPSPRQSTETQSGSPGGPNSNGPSSGDGRRTSGN